MALGEGEEEAEAEPLRRTLPVPLAPDTEAVGEEERAEEVEMVEDTLDESEAVRVGESLRRALGEREAEEESVPLPLAAALGDSFALWVGRVLPLGWGEALRVTKQLPWQEYTGDSVAGCVNVGVLPPVAVEAALLLLDAVPV